MHYPNIEIPLKKIYENTKTVVQRASKYNISITAINKCTNGDKDVAEAFQAGGVVAIGDSRIQNLKSLTDLALPKWLIRIPMISEVEDVVNFSNLSLNSEVKVLKALSDCAEKLGKLHEVILMIDHGDLREGWFDINAFYRDLKEIANLKGIHVRGIGTNSSCAGTIIPEPSTYLHFPEIANMVADLCHVINPIVSGGGSSNYYMIDEGTIPPILNNLRIGELLLFGHETSAQTTYDYLNRDFIHLNGEIIEIKEKCEMLSYKASLIS